jgi:hypothetical protein
VERLHRAIAGALARPDNRERLRASGPEPIGAGPAKLAAFQRAEDGKGGQDRSRIRGTG